MRSGWRFLPLGALFCAAPLCAQTVKDAPLAALLEAGRYAEAGSAASARIAVAKAREIANAASARQLEHAKLLLALVDIGQKKCEQAEAG